jgi:uncharacterized membrane protein
MPGGRRRVAAPAAARPRAAAARTLLIVAAAAAALAAEAAAGAPLITRYGRFDPAGLPDGDGGYTRRLTAAWAALLGGFALAYAVAAAASWPVAALSVAEPLACAGLFLGEHALRNRRFPQHGRATPLRTLRAIRLSHGPGGGPGTVRHAA